MAHKGCQGRLRRRVDKHGVHMYRQDISPPGCIAFTSAHPLPPSSLTHERPDSRAKPRALSKVRHEQPKDESISDRISSLPDRIRKWVNQRRHAPAKNFQTLVCPPLSPSLLCPAMFCCCTNALCPPFYLSALPASSSSSVSRGGFVCHREIISPASPRCKSPSCMPCGLSPRHFLPDCSPRELPPYCEPLIFLAPLFVCSVNGFASNYLRGSRP